VSMRTWTLGKSALALLPAALLILLAVSFIDPRTAQPLFVNTTYYFLMTTVLVWVGTYLHAARDLRWDAARAWVRENWPGLLVAFGVTVIAGFAVHPALRMLSDEANLVGTSKNFFASKTATFTISGKNYYDSYWDIDVVIDRRPPLFPFLVSLVHAVRGYSYENVFLLNLLVLPLFILVAYRLAKSLGGETFAIVAALFMAVHPTTLLSVRSGGFDFITVVFALLVLKSFLDFSRDSSPVKLAILWMNLCMFAEIRYETALFLPPVLCVLLLFKMVSWRTLRPYAFVYALTPAYLLPRIWQSVLRGNIPEQEPGAVTFSLENFVNNAAEYFKPIFSPLSYPAHSGVVIALGIVGGAQWLRWLSGRVRRRDWSAPELRFAVLLVAWLTLQAIITFTYVWGRAQYPSAARLVIAFDTFFSFSAAWTLTLYLRHWRPFVAILVAAAVIAFHLPIASEQRMFNRLTQTRESATTWKFFERLGEKRILIITDHPNLFTIMDYGAMNFDAAKRDPYLLTAFARHLFYDVYVIQQVRLSNNEPLPGYDLWPNRKLTPVLEFQNDADVLIRISRLAH
jgi:Dolichyl-phosphate-mannose-protein mannosyltransferase